MTSRRGPAVVCLGVSVYRKLCTFCIFALSLPPKHTIGCGLNGIRNTSGRGDDVVCLGGRISHKLFVF
jgi:hypothetical protein